MNRTYLWLASMAAAAIAPSAHALQFGFTIDFTSGPLIGQSAQGQFETTPGDGFKNVGNGGLLSFSFTVDGEAFDETHDANYPLFPIVSLTGGTSIDALDYSSTAGPDGGTLSLLLSTSQSVSAATYLAPNSRDASVGSFRSAPALVNLPDSVATGLCLATATASLAMLRRRAQRQ